jgi:hypothetical protein
MVETKWVGVQNMAGSHDSTHCFLKLSGFDKYGFEMIYKLPSDLYRAPIHCGQSISSPHSLFTYISLKVSPSVEISGTQNVV